MPFPLPIDPVFRKEVVISWLEDFWDEVESDNLNRAYESLKIATLLYLGLPAGHGDDDIERQLVEARVKISKHQSM